MQGEKKGLKRTKGRKRKDHGSEKDLGNSKISKSSVPLPASDISVSNPVVGSWPYAGVQAKSLEQDNSALMDRTKGLMVPVGPQSIRESSVTTIAFVSGSYYSDYS